LLAKHIDPYLGPVEVGKISTQLVREWRAALLAAGVSSTVAAKAYRLLRAVDRKALPMLSGVSCGFSGERVTGIEPALSAWEAS
jgi:hypothetical protein